MDLRNRELEVLLKTFKRFPSVREVRLFGSRANGTAGRASDVDLAISAPEADGPEWLALCDALEIAPIIYELDIVRPEKTINKKLNDKILREGVRIYPEQD